MSKNELVAYCIPVDVVSVKGPDSASYLHGQLSQNITALGVGEAAFSLLLAPQGFVTAWLRIVRRSDEEYWLVVDHGHGGTVVERLNRFKLRVDCLITASEMTQTALRPTAVGPTSDSEHDHVEALTSTWSALSASYPDHVTIDVSWPGDAGVDIAGPHKIEIDGLLEGSDDDFEARRIGSGRPAMGSELTEKTIPASVGVVDMSVDFSKGCYVGQELVARVDSRGNNTPTTLYVMEIDGDVASGDDIVDSTGSTVGSLSSVGTDGARSIGLAFIKRGTDMGVLMVSTADGDVPAKTM